ncbi:MAG: NFACT family protein, partial [Anaeroplasmataceae bacterium]|nr:NFACT family protein [Anaeroplasmataceae bacterium]
MSFDGVFLHKLLPEFEILKTGRISKIIESGDTDFILTIRVNHQNINLMISLSSEFSRIHITNKIYTAPLNPKSLTMFLRKHIEGYFIEDIQQFENDRIVYFKLAGYNEMKDYTHKYLICEIMGRYSNLILTDESFKILEVLKHDGVSEFSRTMLPNAIYEFPKTNKINPFKALDFTHISSPKDLCNQFCGVSMLLSIYAFKNDQILDNFKDALNFKTKPSIFKNNLGKVDFYYHPLNFECIQEYTSLSELLDEYYYEEDNKAKIKNKTNDLANFVAKQIKKNEKKIEKLESDLISAQNADEDKIKGE